MVINYVHWRLDCLLEEWNGTNRALGQFHTKTLRVGTPIRVMYAQYLQHNVPHQSTADRQIMLGREMVMLDHNDINKHSDNLLFLLAHTKKVMK